MRFLKRILRTWTFWYLLLPAMLWPVGLSLRPIQSRGDEIAVMVCALLSVQSVPVLYLTTNASGTLAPLWVSEVAIVAWAFAGGAVAAWWTGRRAADA